MYLQGDFDNCGECGRACGTGETCWDGWCYPVCPRDAPWYCDGRCVNLLTDENSCGTCRHVCGAGQTCTAGECTG